jgi:hypothetical protein
MHIRVRFAQARHSLPRVVLHISFSILSGAVCLMCLVFDSQTGMAHSADFVFVCPLHNAAFRRPKLLVGKMKALPEFFVVWLV